MSVISCKEISQNRSIEYHANTSRTYRRVFRVECSSALDGPLAVIQANGIPAQYSTYATATESDAFALCTEVSAKTEGDGMKTWIVEATYSTNAIPKNQDPLQDPVKYKIGFDQFTKVARQDVNGVPVSNSMGDTFIPPVVVDDSRVIYTIMRNRAATQPALLGGHERLGQYLPVGRYGRAVREVQVDHGKREPGPQRHRLLCRDL